MSPAPGVQSVALTVIGVVLAIVAWSTLGYPLLLRIISGLRPAAEPGAAQRTSSRVALVFTIIDGADAARRKIENSLALDWAGATPDIIMVVDGPVDSFAGIAREYLGRGVRVLSSSVRRGKAHCQRLALDVTDADIIVFTDVGVSVSPGSLEAFRRTFDDANVGCVSGTDVTHARSGRLGGEDLYVRMEMALRARESALGALIGVSGSLFAVRRELCDPWPVDLTSDLALPLAIRARGHRVVASDGASGHYFATDSMDKEYRRKVRTVLHGMQVVWALRRTLSPFRHPLLATQVATHKLIRWLFPVFFVATLGASTVLAQEHAVFRVVQVMLLVPLAAALLATIAKPLQRFLVVRLALYVVYVMVAIAAAWPRFVSGDKMAVWDETPR